MTAPRDSLDFWCGVMANAPTSTIEALAKHAIEILRGRAAPLGLDHNRNGADALAAVGALARSAYAVEILRTADNDNAEGES